MTRPGCLACFAAVTVGALAVGLGAGCLLAGCRGFTAILASLSPYLVAATAAVYLTHRRK